jgi:hypothetical protein
MEQRRTKRFKLQLPLSITRTGAERVALPGETRDISSGGVLFTTETKPDTTSGSIEYVITLDHQGPVHLRCIGKVVRCQRDWTAESPATPSYIVAATLERYEFLRDS